MKTRKKTNPWADEDYLQTRAMEDIPRWLVMACWGVGGLDVLALTSMLNVIDVFSVVWVVLSLIAFIIMFLLLMRIEPMSMSSDPGGGSSPSSSFIMEVTRVKKMSMFPQHLVVTGNIRKGTPPRRGSSLVVVRNHAVGKVVDTIPSGDAMPTPKKGHFWAADISSLPSDIMTITTTNLSFDQVREGDTVLSP